MYKLTIHNLPTATVQKGTEQSTDMYRSKNSTIHRDVSTPPAPCRHGRAYTKLTLDKSQKQTNYTYTSTDKVYKTTSPECIITNST